MSADPLLTVAIPTFNSAHFLTDAVSSIMRQGIEDFEILIVDNASEDDTEAVVKSLGNSRIRYIRNSSNLGSTENGNLCLANSRGRYIKFLCADDVLLDGVLQKQLSVLENRSDVVLVTCDYLPTDPNLNIQGSWSAFPGSHPGRRIINFCLSRMVNAIGGPSNIMIRRAAATGVLSDASYRLLSDLKFCLQVLEHGDYVSIDEPGILYRRHPASDFVTNCFNNNHILEYLRLVTEFHWWNPFNCLLALARAGVDGRRIIRENRAQACAPRAFARSLEASIDLMYKQLFQCLNRGQIASHRTAS